MSKFDRALDAVLSSLIISQLFLVSTTCSKLEIKKNITQTVCKCFHNLTEYDTHLFVQVFSGVAYQGIKFSCEM